MKLRAAAACAALAGALALPVAAPAATTTTAQPQHYTLHTRLASRYQAGEYDGTLTLSITADGIVQGWYRGDDGLPRPVTGGISGTAIWFDIGQVHPLHFNGTLEHGVIHAVASIPSPDVYELDATPAGASRATRTT